MNQTSGISQYQYGNGLTCSVMASVLFGITPWLVQQLYISGNQLFWVRMLTGSLCLMLTITLSAQWHDVRKMLHHSRNLMFLLPGTVLVGIQWWLFVWAPVNQQTKELALGYFLLPLTLALTGWLFYGEKLNTAQKPGDCIGRSRRSRRTLATGTAALGDSGGSRSVPSLLSGTPKD